MIKTVDNYEQVDAANIAQFKETGSLGRYDGDDIYTCVLCGKKCSIDRSCSTKGHNLICSWHLWMCTSYSEFTELSEFVWGGAENG